MNRVTKIIIIITFAVLMIIPAAARTKDGTTPTDPFGKIYDLQKHNINQIEMYLANYGVFGQNTLTGNSGMSWPAGFPGETYIFGAGIWVGALLDTGFTVVGTDTVWHTDTLVTCGYNPGSGGFEFVPGDGEDPYFSINEEYRVYMSTDDNAGYGWPLKDYFGEDSIISMQDSWCEFNDLDSTKHFATENKPLGLLVRQTGYAWVGPLKEDIIFLKWDILNIREDGKDLRSCYVAINTDNDIGNEASEGTTEPNDLVGYIDTMSVEDRYGNIGNTMINIGYQFQLEPEAGWVHTPGIIVYKFLDTPYAQNEVDLYHNGSYIIYPYSRLGMTTFSWFTLSTDPDTKEKRYQVMAGYDYERFNPLSPEDSYEPFPAWGVGVAGYPGHTMPATEVDDQRFMMSSGPFTLYNSKYNEMEQTLVIAIMIAKNTDELVEKALIAQSIYDGGWVGPTAPGAVKASAVGLNKSVRLYWDNALEQVADKYYSLVGDSLSPAYNPAYRQYDLEGYKIYRSSGRSGGPYELIGKFDKINEYTLVKYDSIITLNNVSGEYETTYLYDTVGTNSGIPYYFEDTGLINGFNYYYYIAAYDVNYLDYKITASGDTIGTNPISLQGSGHPLLVTPRSITSNYTFATANLTLESGNVDTLSMGLEIIPLLDTLTEDMANDTYKIKFVSIDSTSINSLTPKYVYELYKNDTLVTTNFIDMDTTLVGNDAGELEVERWSLSESKNNVAYKGLIVRVNSYDVKATEWPSDFNATTGITVTGSYNDSILKAAYMTTGRQFSHGSKNYTLTWHEKVVGTDTSLTVTVFDVDNNIEIPYSNRVIGDNWHFNYSSVATPDKCPEYLTKTSISDALKGLYFSNMKLFFDATNPSRPAAMAWANKPKDGDVWTITVTMNDTAAVYAYPPIGSVYSFTIVPASFSEATRENLSSVKVVPNPYVVRGQLDLDYNYRKILFTNLPNVCTIKIYTLAGTRIKTIEHNTTYVNPSYGNTVYDNTLGIASWDVLTEKNQVPASGIYLFTVETPQGNSCTGKFAIIQ